MSLRPFFAYYGGKYRIAPRYPTPRRRLLVEPFAGAAGYSTRHHRHDVRLYDVDPIVAGVWDYLIRVPASEMRSLPIVEAIEDLPDDVPQEARWLIGFWLQPGRPSPRKRISVRAATRPNTTWGPAVQERLSSQVDLIRHWRVFEKSWEDVPGVDATYFIDPPYQAKAGRAYTHNAVDFEALGRWCRRLPGQVIVCEQEGATWLPFEKLCEIRGQARRSVEVVWASR